MGSTDQLPSVSTSSDLSPEFSEARKHLIVALDFATEAEALALVDRLGNLCQWFKVGLELYLFAGNSIIKKLTEQGYSVFLDLKLHDIPNTVAGAVRSATSQGATLLTVHTSGGPVMLKEGDTWTVKAAGPTTSIREEPYEADIIQRYGVRAIIGKGGMGPRTSAGQTVPAGSDRGRWRRAW